MSRSPRDQALALLASELAFFALTLAAAIGFCRLFEGWSFLPPLVLAAIGSHLLAAGCRRRGWNVGVAALLSVVALAELVTLSFYRSTSWYGLPTLTTWDTMWADLEASWSTFSTAIAPVPATGGYLVAAVIGVWIAAFLADSFAFRALAAIEAILPSGILFVFASALGADRHRLFCTALWLGAAVLAFALHRTMAQEGTGWLAGGRRGTVGAVARTAAVLGLGAVAVALVVGPALPGAGEEALLDTKQGGNGTRQTVSPLVDIKGRIVERSDVEAFNVASDGKAYWRLTALEDFDGRLWTSERGYGDAEGQLGGGLPEALTTPVTQDFQIVNLDAIWFPAAYAPDRIDIAGSVRFDEDTSSLVTRRNEMEPGTTYRVVSRVPNLTPEVLEQAPALPPEELDDVYLELPGSYPVGLRVIAEQVTAGATTPYAKAKLLQDYFQTFTYDISVQAGSGTNAIERFLQARRGYCEQFAGTFAAFARSLGMPARVAVGFTPGELQGDGRYHVLGKHAHAWPEVYFTGIGWVPFEPTPSRGIPGAAEVYTGIPAQQEGESPVATVPTVPTASSVPVTPSTINPNFDPDLGILGEGFGDNLTPAGEDGGVPTWLVVLPIVVVVLALLGVAWLLLAPRLARARWDRRRRAASTGAEKVLVSWREATDVLARSGSPAKASETPLEYAERLTGNRDADADLVQTMAGEVTVAAYGRDDVDEEVVGRTDDARRELEHRRWSRSNWKEKARWLADPRPLLRRRLPGDEDARPEQREHAGVS
jgi:transglutaminase-like putative cysteine protease